MNSGKTPCEIIKDALPDQLVGCLSGPTFAGEVAEGKPAAMTLASESLEPIVQSTQEALSGKSMRIYLSEDLKGVELGGCMKNVYAIAAGCCQGLKLGDNALCRSPYPHPRGNGASRERFGSQSGDVLRSEWIWRLGGYMPWFLEPKSYVWRIDWPGRLGE